MAPMLLRAFVLLTVTALAGCASGIALTEAGRSVERVSDADRPAGCQLLGDVAIGVPPDAARPRTEDELVMLMRNKVGDSGGDVVIVDMSEQRDAETERPYWIGRGRGYSCPEPEPEPEASPAPDEDPADEAPDEELPEEESGDGAGGEITVDDILAE